MKSSWMLRVVYRRKRLLVGSLVLFLVAGLAAVLFVPFTYESELMIERQPPRLSPQLTTEERSTEFELSRLTSETQRTVTIFRSRPFLEAWAKAIGKSSPDPRRMDKIVARLSHAMTVQPVNYTDMFTLRARAPSSSEAERRVTALAQTFIDWDAAQNGRRGNELIALLERHIAGARSALNNDFTRLRELKASQAVSLAGSVAQQSVQADIDAHEKLLAGLTAEQEEARRATEGFGRTQILAGPSTSADPVFPLGRRLALALASAVLLSLALVFLAEWQDNAIYRAQDIIPWLPSVSVFPVAPTTTASSEAAMMPSLRPLAENVAALARSHGSAVVQVTSVSGGEAQSAVCSSLADLLSPRFRVAVRSGGEKVTGEGDVLILDLPPIPGALPAANLGPEADVSCVVLTAGRTPKQILKPLRQQIGRYPHQTWALILNRYQDPLPARFR